MKVMFANLANELGHHLVGAPLVRYYNMEQIESQINMSSTYCSFLCCSVLISLTQLPSALGSTEAVQTNGGALKRQ